MPEPKKRTGTRRAKDAPPSAQGDAAAASADTASPTDAPLKPGQLEAREDLRRNMLRSIITEPLLSKIQMDPTGTFDVIISLNELFGGGLAAALVLVKERAELWDVGFTEVSGYIFGRLQAPQIQQLAVESQQLNSENRRNEAVVYRIWEDSDIAVTLTRSLTTIKADAAQRSFHALGEGIVWAVLDSGVDGTHVHFAEKQSMHGRIDTLGVRAPVEHRDYTPDGVAQAEELAATTITPDLKRLGAPSALMDRLGHGSHVAGIIAGYWTTEAPEGLMVIGTEVRDETAATTGRDKLLTSREALKSISGVAPLAKIISMKVIADVTRSDDYKQTRGQGKVSWVLRALDDIQQWNQYGKRLVVHGVNMSIGYDFDPRWFACGQSPICVEVNRLVKSGVSVVVSAGNSGYSSYITGGGTEESSYRNLTITDPGNAEFAITVGSTHREMPHTYGVSYFSSRGPTGDGRRKPDLLAPGERIRSCAAGREQDRYKIAETTPVPVAAADALPEAPGTTAHATEGATLTTPIAPGSAPEDGRVLYCEQTGTSMAAPHVSGAVAAFLSVRTEFIGQPERVKALFLANAIDLGRERAFQGEGLLDLMKVLQAC
ncbi:MAG: S8 family serine peptidase [Gemmatimonadaceae bacterium]|nr:S8 family serine peptidase [Gemmatimonadaceae bacterium]